MKHNNKYDTIRYAIDSETWKVKDVYIELIQQLYCDQDIKLDPTDIHMPYKYLTALLALVRVHGDLSVVQVDRIFRVVDILREIETNYYIRILGENVYDEKPSRLVKQIVLNGGDAYHTIAHNLMVASFAVLLKLLNPSRYNISGKELEVAILTTLFHDSVKASDANKEMATWDEDSVMVVLDEVYSPAVRSEIVASVLHAVEYTDYTNQKCPFYVDFSPGSSEVSIDWESISIEGELLVISDWLGQTVFVQRRSRNVMVGLLYQFWLVQTGKDKSDEFPMKISIFRAVLECLLKLPELFLIDENVVDDLRDELLYFQDTKTSVAQCFNSKRELHEMGIGDAMKLMNNYLGR